MSSIVDDKTNTWLLARGTLNEEGVIVIPTPATQEVLRWAVRYLKDFNSKYNCYKKIAQLRGFLFGRRSILD
jgi:hypothetical protein